MAKKITLLFVLVLTSNLLCSTSTTITKPKKMHPQRVTMRLIHYNSIYSPFYNPNSVDNNDALLLEYNRSLERWSYIQAKARGNVSIPSLSSTGSDGGGGDVRAPVIPNLRGTYFMVNFSIGTPPVSQLVIMDTASNLLWVQCEPCEYCWKQSVDLFDPRKSSTYKPLSCYSNDCEIYLPVEGKCDQSSTCLFHMYYIDGSSVSGVQAKETLTFKTSDEGLAKLPDQMFGCASQAAGGRTGTTQPSGVMGLGASTRSLSGSFGNGFSYCLGDVRHPSYGYNHLTLGHGPAVRGFPIPIEFYNDMYFLPMEGISFGGKRLTIDPVVFRRGKDGGGTVIDSGSSITTLPEPAYDLLTTEITRFLGSKFKRIYHYICYKGSIERDVSTRFPITEFHFLGGNLALGARNVLFQHTEDMYCLAIHPSPPGGVGIIGAFAQQGYNIAYNLLLKRIYFEKVDCRNLYSD